ADEAADHRGAGRTDGGNRSVSHAPEVRRQRSSDDPAAARRRRFEQAGTGGGRRRAARYPGHEARTSHRRAERGTVTDEVGECRQRVRLKPDTTRCRCACGARTQNPEPRTQNPERPNPEPRTPEPPNPEP